MIYGKLVLLLNPFDWLEASYFYYRPNELLWEVNNVPGHFLDKGFNVKFIYRPNNRYLPNIAVGLDDFAGTGYFNREYIVGTSNYSNLKVSLGVGWGKFTGQNKFNNPLDKLSPKFSVRPKLSDVGYGGNPSYNQWFRGDAAIFGGFEYNFRNIKKLKLKAEYDPYDYMDFSANNRRDASLMLRKKDSNINIGLSYKVNKFLTIDTSYIKGNTLNLNFNIALTFNDDLSSKPSFKPEIKKYYENQNKQSFYEDLLRNLNNNNLFLQTAELNERQLDVSISTSQYRNALRSASYASFIANETANLNNVDLGSINITHINAGVELNNVSFIANHLEKDSILPIEVKKYYTKISSGQPRNYLDNEFQPKVEFPVIFSSLSPAIVSHIGNPERFYFGGVALKYNTEAQFSRNLILTSEINYSLFNNIQDTIAGPGSKMEHVRTDLVQYLKQDDFYLTSMQLDYIWAIRKNFYAKISAGIFETMYGGFGGEILFKPFENNFTVGADLFYVKQRTFEQRFDFRDYETLTGHINFGYLLPLGIESNISFGKYLAKDIGYTLDLSRRTASGFKAGIYFTRTDVSAELFGEGSFDKGFYFQIPLDLLSNSYNGNYSTFRLSPLTRDGGAKLTYEKELRGLIYNATSNELQSQWKGFLN